MTVQRLDMEDQRQLRDLRHHWDEAYKIVWHQSRGEFTATRIGSSDKVLTDTTLEGLRGQVREDYAAWKSAGDRMST
jgi:hypothetical protein